MKKFLRNILILIGIIIATAFIIELFIEVTLPAENIYEHVERYETDSKCPTGIGEVRVIKQIGIEDEDGNVLWRPVLQDEIISYCREPGTGLTHSSYSKEKVDQFLKDIEYSTSSDCRSDNSNNGYGGHAPDIYYQSSVYYKCNKEHYTEKSRYHVIKRKSKDDTTPIDYGYVENLYDMAYINSYTMKSPDDDEEVFETQKQQAIWHSVISEVEEVKCENGKDAGLQIVKEADEYQSIQEEIVNNNDKVFQEDLTNKEQIALDTDTKTKLHKLGPFKLKYIGESIEDRRFVGISDMYLVNGKEPDKRIEVKNLIIPSKNPQKDTQCPVYEDICSPRFFSIADDAYDGKDNPNKVDYFYFEKYYPASEEEFYVEFEYTGNLSNASLDLKVEFSHLECYTKMCLREGEYYQTELENENDEYNSHTHKVLNCSHGSSHSDSCYKTGEDGKSVLNCSHGSSHSDSCYRHPTYYGCKKTYTADWTNDPAKTQDAMFIVESNNRREIIKETVSIPFGTIEKIQTNMKLGGFVFEDVPTGKENIANGIMDEGTDLKLQNIEVTLYDASTNKPAKLSTLKEESRYEIYNNIYKRHEKNDENSRRISKEELSEIQSIIESTLYDNLYKKSQTNEIITTREQERLLEQLKKAIEDIEKEANDPNDYLRRTNPTLTDKNGYYEFRGVDPEKKYYLKFTYNGQIYTCTDYLKDTETEYASVKDMVDKDAYQKSVNNNTSVIANEKWKNTSKGTELKSERDAYNEKRFGNIYSSPDNYSIKDSPLKLIIGDTNKTFNIYELSGITLGSDGKYKYNEDDQLIDSNFVIDEDGKIIESKEYREGIINKTIKAYIKNEYKDNQNHNYPTDVRTQIYKRIAKPSDDILWEKFQFIEDCKINSYTKNSKAENINEFDKYPVYDRFTTYVSDGNKYPNNSYKESYIENISTYRNHTLKAIGTGNVKVWDKIYEGTNYHQRIEYMESEKNVEFKNVYPGQLLINQGLWRRQEVDISLRKDVYKATLTVNGKTETYKYNSRSQVTADQMKKLIELKKAYDAVKGQNNEAEAKASNEYSNYLNSLSNTYWDIQAKIVNYDNYYGEKYYRELYESDYNFSGNGKNELEAYITYQITVRNNSESILASVNEIVDYYDKVNYDFVPNKSWAMYTKDSTKDTDYMNGITVPDQDFYDIMTGDINKVNSEKYRPITTRARNENSQADFDGEFNDKGYNTLYINSLAGKKLQSGEEAYLYLTFKVNGSGKDLKVENSTDPDKKNIAEINGYSTFYKEGTKLPNGKSIDNNNTPAGIIDQDSNPGNFRAEYIPDNNEEIYEHYFEDDTDRARGIRIPPPDISLPDEEGEYSRKISGNVWEDYRTEPVGGAYIGNGIRENGEPLINGVKVELLEVIFNDKGEFETDKNGDAKTKLVATTTTARNNATGKDGYYEFSNIYPGDYIVRFTYGGEYNAKYNGQDYKSTSYQVGLNTKSERTDVAKEGTNGYYSYTDVGIYNGAKGQNVSGSYGYDIYAADTNSKNVSDAKDLWRTRASVNSYSSNDYKGVTYDLANILNENGKPDKNTPNNNTQMIAETGVIRLEFEYNRQNSNANTVVNSNGIVNTEGNKVDNNGYNGTTTGKNSYTGKNNSSSNNFNGTYHIENVDLGLEERPKAQLKLTKEVTGVKVILANGNVAVDSTPKNTAGTATWTPIVDNEIKSEIGEPNTYRMVVTAQDNSKKLVSIIMDDELMHGASIGITYDITVTNVGEIDYADTIFYYKGAEGNIGDAGTIVRTSADVILDYVPNNLQFRTTDNAIEGWSVIDNNTITSNGYLTSSLTTEPTSNTDTNQNVLKKFNTIIQIQNTGLNKDLVPNIADNTATKEKSVTTKQLVLSQLMTAQNTDDDRVYENIAEIVKISNTVGRRMAFSIQGNQNPLDEPAEVDSFKAESVRVLPPFGIGNIITYIAIALTSLGVLVTGIIIIKKKVINK